MSFTQLEGNIKFGSTTADTSYNSSVTSLVITRATDIITVPKTFANALTDSIAGGETQTLTVNFLGDPLSASSFWAELWDAMDTDDKTLYFAGTLNDSTSVSATNPKFSGVVVVSSLDTGGQVGELRAQSQTFPIKAGTLARTTTGSI